MKCVCLGIKGEKYKELEGYDYPFYKFGWFHVANNRMALGLIGCQEDNGEVIFDGEVVNYTGIISFGNFLGSFTLKNGYRDDAPYQNGLLPDNQRQSEEWAQEIMKKYHEGE